MKIELKNIKHSEWASEETDCYQATLHVDGQKIGTVGNDGHGGCDYFHPNSAADRAAFKAADEWCKANLPKHPLGIEDEHGNQQMMDTDLELRCGELLARHLREKDLKKLLRKAVVFKPNGANEIRQFTWKNTSKIDERHVEAVRKKGEPITILNDLPFDQALDLFTRYA